MGERYAMYWHVKCVLIQWEYRCIGAGEGKPPYMQIATSLRLLI